MSEAEIKTEGLHLRFDDRLVAQAKMLTEKIPRVQRDLNSFILFPDARREEVYISLIEAGEIEPALDGATSLSISTIGKVESEYQDRLKFYQDKVDRLRKLVELIKEEQGLRKDGRVIRSPIGTTYYVDFDNGNDSTNDGSTPTKSNGDGPWATLSKAATTLATPDKAVVRRGMTEAVSAHVSFTNSGTRPAPIIIEGDFDDVWGDEVTAGETATLTFGSKTVTFAGDISASIAAGKWIYETTEDNRKFAYEVESVSGGSNEIVTLFLPYKGAQAGSGKTVEVMLANPIWNTAAGDYALLFNGDSFWMFQGLHLRGTQVSGVISLDSCLNHIFKDCIIEGNGGGDFGIKVTDDVGVFYAFKCRFYNYRCAIKSDSGLSVVGYPTTCRDCLFDGNNAANSTTREMMMNDTIIFIDCEMKNHALGDFAASADHVGLHKLRNCLLSSATQFDLLFLKKAGAVFSEDHGQIVSSNRQHNTMATVESGPTIESETTKVRTGGGTTSIKVTPSTELSTAWEHSRWQLFEYAIYLVQDVAKTFTVYFSSDDDTDWDADPLATELWIEAEYWGHASNKARAILKSTGVCDNFDADDAVWDSLTVTITPLQTGVVYLRGFYCKAQEGGKSNIFYCDTKVVIS